MFVKIIQAILSNPKAVKNLKSAGLSLAGGVLTAIAIGLTGIDFGWGLAFLPGAISFLINAVNVAKQKVEAE